MLAFVSITHSITIFPAAFLTAIEMLSLCTSMPIYLVLVIEGCSFLERLSRTLKTYSKRGALYIASRHRTARIGGSAVSGKGITSNTSEIGPASIRSTGTRARTRSWGRVRRATVPADDLPLPSRHAPRVHHS